LILFKNPRCSNTFILRLTLLSDVSQSLAILEKLGQHSPLLLALFARAINTSFASASPTLASQASNKYLVALVDVLSITKAGLFVSNPTTVQIVYVHHFFPNQLFYQLVRLLITLARQNPHVLFQHVGNACYNLCINTHLAASFSAAVSILSINLSATL
jgi:ABC-type phosphate/phosphonate transport system permease subunit